MTLFDETKSPIGLDCLACRHEATRYITVNNQVLPSCDKCYNNHKVTVRRWMNAKTRWDKLMKEYEGKKCILCGEQAKGEINAALVKTLAKLPGYYPYNDEVELLPICGNCDCDLIEAKIIRDAGIEQASFIGVTCDR